MRFDSIENLWTDSQSTPLKNLNDMYVHVESDDALDSSEYTTR